MRFGEKILEAVGARVPGRPPGLEGGGEKRTQTRPEKSEAGASLVYGGIGGRVGPLQFRIMTGEKKQG